MQSKFKADDFSKVRNLGISVLSNKIPVRYILLNPYDVVAQRATSFDKFGLYAKVLSEYEVERLRDPKTDEDREIYDALPADIKKRIKSDSWAVDGIKVKLNPERLRYSLLQEAGLRTICYSFWVPGFG